MDKAAEKVARSHVLIRPPVRRNLLAGTTSRGSARRVINAPFGILLLVVSIKVARAMLARSVSFFTLMLLLSAGGDLGKNKIKTKTRTRIQKQDLTPARAGRSPSGEDGRLGGCRKNLWSCCPTHAPRLHHLLAPLWRGKRAAPFVSMLMLT